MELPKLNSDAPKLDHVGKDRPRPMKKYKATARPTVASQKDGNGEETNLEEGLNQFFGKKSPSDNTNSDVKVNGRQVELVFTLKLKTIIANYSNVFQKYSTAMSS